MLFRNTFRNTFRPFRSIPDTGRRLRFSEGWENSKATIVGREENRTLLHLGPETTPFSDTRRDVYMFIAEFRFDFDDAVITARDATGDTILPPTDIGGVNEEAFTIPGLREGDEITIEAHLFESAEGPDDPDDVLDEEPDIALPHTVPPDPRTEPTQRESFPPEDELIGETDTDQTVTLTWRGESGTDSRRHLIEWDVGMGSRERTGKTIIYLNDGFVETSNQPNRRGAIGQRSLPFEVGAGDEIAVERIGYRTESHPDPDVSGTRLVIENSVAEGVAGVGEPVVDGEVEVTCLGADGPVSVGEPFEIGAEVTNNRPIPMSVTITVEVSESIGTETVTVDSGETRQVSIGVEGIGTEGEFAAVLNWSAESA